MPVKRFLKYFELACAYVVADMCGKIALKFMVTFEQKAKLNEAEFIYRSTETRATCGNQTDLASLSVKIVVQLDVSGMIAICRCSSSFECSSHGTVQNLCEELNEINVNSLITPCISKYK